MHILIPMEFPQCDQIIWVKSSQDAHYGVVRETVGTPTPAEEHALAAQEIVVRSLCDLLCREP